MIKKPIRKKTRREKKNAIRVPKTVLYAMQQVTQYGLMEEMKSWEASAEDAKELHIYHAYRVIQEFLENRAHTKSMEGQPWQNLSQS